MKKISCKILLCFFTFVLICSNLNAGDSWGLSFPVEGEQPRGNATKEYLKQYDSFFVGDNSEKILYLTFDAGYENNLTESILNTLKEHDVPAAFFLVGTYIKKHPELILRMVNEGHIVANHTMSHPDMSKINNKELFLKELTQAEEHYRNVTGREMPKLYRPPSGIYSEANLEMAKELGYKTIFWSLTYQDWGDKELTKEQAFAKLIPRVHPGAVILLHSTYKTNAIILDELLTKYKDMGFRFESLCHLVGGCEASYLNGN